MAEYTIKVRRYQPESGEAAYWEEFGVELDPSLSVLDGLLQTKDRQDGSLAVRCSCRAAICGSCGMKINGKSGLGCQTQIGEAQELADKKASAVGGPSESTSDPDRDASSTAWSWEYPLHPCQERCGTGTTGMNGRRPLRRPRKKLIRLGATTRALS